MTLRMKRLLMGSTAELRHEPHPWRVRATVDGTTVVDSARAQLVWEPRRLVPVFAVPTADVAAELRETEPAGPDPDLPPLLGPQNFAQHTTPGRAFDVVVDGRTLPQGAFAPDAAELDGLVLLDFDAFDSWRQEDEQLVGHAHDPYKRIDVARSSRHVVVRFAGEVLADSRRAVALYETHLPVRWYLPAEDVRTDRLVPSRTRTTCAYKGHASYLSLADGGPGSEDIVWTYPEPLNDAVPVGGMLCFWAERTELTVDGEPVGRPVTPWSSAREQQEAEEDAREFG